MLLGLGRLMAAIADDPAYTAAGVALQRQHPDAPDEGRLGASIAPRAIFATWLDHVTADHALQTTFEKLWYGW